MLQNRIATMLAVFTLTFLYSAIPANAAAKPKIRALTAFIRIDPAKYREQIGHTLEFLRRAKAEFARAGYEVETIRLTTQPFGEYIRGAKREEALQLFHDLNDLTTRNSLLVNIGPVSTAVDVALAGDILASNTNLNSSMMVTDQRAIDWDAVRKAARLVKYLEEHSRDGEATFRFAATAMLKPYAPFFPGSYHNGAGRQFSIGLEGANVVQEAFAGVHDVTVASARLSAALGAQAQAIEKIAVRVQQETGWSYVGIDATPAPLGDVSIGAAIEELTNAPVGASGTMTAAAVITQAVRAAAVKHVGFSGLMLPIMEDSRLAQRWSEQTYTMDSLLAYSAVCGTGLDTVPLPGETTEAQMAKIIGDVASLAVKWGKPLSARLQPIPGKRAGNRTTFRNPYLVNTTIQRLVGSR